MFLMIQIATGTAVGLLVALMIIDYFEEILLITLISLLIGIPMIWWIGRIEGNTHILKSLIGILSTLFQIKLHS